MLKTYASWLDDHGASQESINALSGTVGSLPNEYLSLLSQGNGGETSLSKAPFNFCLDSAEDALSYWQSGTYPLRGVFIFGGNGGGELLALDMRQSKPWPVICFDPIDPEGSLENIAVDFESFLGLVTDGA